jgi:hypothetical protein
LQESGFGLVDAHTNIFLGGLRKATKKSVKTSVSGARFKASTSQTRTYPGSCGGRASRRILIARLQTEV